MFEPLSIGSRNNRVKLWQNFLVKEGYNIAVDGKFGGQTKAATEDWRVKHGYSPGGDVTEAMFNSIPDSTDVNIIAWGAKVSRAFVTRVLSICNFLEINPNWLMACMAFESAETFSPSIKNSAGSGAVGLIQFMPSTAAVLGTSIEKLSKMSALTQLDYVEAYFDSFSGKLKNLQDVYMTILWPGAIGKPLSYVLFDKSDIQHPKRYIQNKGLDWNKDGKITKEEASAHIAEKLHKGFLVENALYLK